MSNPSPDDIKRAKQKFPLPQLMQHYGLGDKAKSSALSPFREEKNPSFGIFKKQNGEWNWKDASTGEGGDEIDFIEKYEGRSTEDSRIKFVELAGVKMQERATPFKKTKPVLRKRSEAEKEAAPAAPSKPFEWDACVEAFTPKVNEIAEWRGFSEEFVETLRSQKLIGLYNGQVAFPVTDDTGIVVACHYRMDDGTWRYEPKTRTAPFIIGKPEEAKEIYIFESQWDAFAVADKLGWHEGRIDSTAFLITRGAANGKLIAGLLNPDAKITVFPQNDEVKKGKKTPSEEWFNSITETAEQHKLYRAEIPTEFKDPNDWVKSGIEDKALWDVITNAKRPRTSKLPLMRDMSTMMGQNLPAKPPELIKGLLHKGSKLIVGGTSKGKKTYSLLDLSISIATGTEWWGHPTTQGPVCYINFEIQEPFFAQRVEDICKAKGVTLQPGQFMAWTLRGQVEGIEKMAEEMLQDLMEQQFSLITFDPIYKALGDRDENKAGDVASMLNELEAIAVKTGSAIAFGAHYSKGNQAGKDSMDRIGGSGVFARDPDSILTMTAHEQEDCFTVDATLRNFPPIEPFVLHWEWPYFRATESLDPAALKQTNKGRPQTTNDKAILDRLTKPLSFSEWYAELDKDLYTRDQLKNAIRRLATAAFIKKNDMGHWIKVNRRFGGNS